MKFINVARSRIFLSTVGVLFMLVLVMLVLTLPLQALAAAGADGNGSISVTIVTPAGVPANVALVGKSTYYAAKAPTGTTATIVLSVPRWGYHVVAPPVTSAGSFYTAVASRSEVSVGIGQTVAVNVQYTLANSAQGFHATTIGATSIALAWTAAAGDIIRIDRTTGTTPVSEPGKGTNVPVIGSTATDSGLQPGTLYTYTLFTLYHGNRVGPLVLHINTANTANPSQAVYVTSPNTLILKPGDVTSATTTGGGVHVVLGNGIATPVLGAAVILPVLPSLPGGFLGTVITISPDGHALDLVAGGLSDAFDYYSIKIPDISAVNANLSTASQNATASPTSHTSVSPMLFTSPGAATLDCSASASVTITFTPSITLAGYFNATIDKYNVLGVNVPQGASLDMAVTVTVTGAASIKASAALTCTITLSKIVKLITVDPVPISFYLEPQAQFTLGGSLDLSNIGATATAGVAISGSFGLTNGADFTASPIMSAAPLDPVITARGNVQLKLGGDVIVGPGAGTPDAGVIAGLGGVLYPIDADFQPVLVATAAGQATCLKTQIAFTRENMRLTAKAWLGNWDLTRVISLDSLNGSTPYLGSPWYLPKGCQQPGYTFTPFSAPGMDADAINNAGTIAGGGINGGMGFVGIPGNFTTFDYQPSGQYDPNLDWDLATGINNSGQLVGISGQAGNGPPFELGWLFSNGGFTSFAVPGSQETDPLGINDNGEIVGYYVVTNGQGNAQTSGFLYSNGVFTDFNYPDPNGGSTIPLGINDSGQIVGDVVYCNGKGCNGSTGTPFSFLYTPAANGQPASFTTLVTPNGDPEVVTAINNNGEWTGYFINGNVQVGFVSDGTDFTQFALPVTSSQIYAVPTSINDDGDITLSDYNGTNFLGVPN